MENWNGSQNIIEKDIKFSFPLSGCHRNPIYPPKAEMWNFCENVSRNQCPGNFSTFILLWAVFQSDLLSIVSNLVLTIHKFKMSNQHALKQYGFLAIALQINHILKFLIFLQIIYHLIFCGIYRRAFYSLVCNGCSNVVRQIRVFLLVGII